MYDFGIEKVLMSRWDGVWAYFRGSAVVIFTDGRKAEIFTERCGMMPPYDWWKIHWIFWDEKYAA